MTKHELAWDKMKQMDRFTVTDVANAVEMDLEECRKSIKRLEKSGYLEIVSGIGVAGRPYFYRVKPEVTTTPQFGRGGTSGLKKVRSGMNGQQLIWNALRINRKLTVGTAEAVTKLNSRTIYRYLNDLEKAGYVKCQRHDRVGSNFDRTGVQNIWKLIRETGPKAPILRRGKGFWDQNEDKFYSLDGGKTVGGRTDEVA
jgi:hypothetical protein